MCSQRYVNAARIFDFPYREIREHIEAEPASASATHSAGILPAEVTCQAVEAATPESGRVPFELLPKNGRSLVLEALSSKRINSRRNPRLNIPVRYRGNYLCSSTCNIYQ